MDEGQPISYLELDAPRAGLRLRRHARSAACDHVVAAPEEDIFHGIVIEVPMRLCFIAADDIASLHERGVDLRIDSAAVANAPEPHGAAPAWHDREPGVKPSTLEARPRHVHGDRSARGRTGRKED